MTIKLNTEQWSVGSNMKGQDVPCKKVCVSFKDDGRPILNQSLRALYGENKVEGKGYARVYWDDVEFNDRYVISFQPTTKGWSCFGQLGPRTALQLNGKFFDNSACLGDVVAFMAGFSSFQSFQGAGVKA